MATEGTSHARVKYLMYLFSVHFEQCRDALPQCYPRGSKMKWSCEPRRETVVVCLLPMATEGTSHARVKCLMYLVDVHFD